MTTNDDFWLLLHDLASAVDSDGQPWKGKANTLAGYFALYPPVARKQLRDEFDMVLSILTDMKGVLDKEAAKP